MSVYLAKMSYKQYMESEYGEIAQLSVHEYGKEMDKLTQYSNHLIFCSRWNEAEIADHVRMRGELAFKEAVQSQLTPEEHLVCKSRLHPSPHPPRRRVQIQDITSKQLSKMEVQL